MLLTIASIVVCIVFWPLAVCVLALMYPGISIPMIFVFLVLWLVYAIIKSIVEKCV